MATAVKCPTCGAEVEWTAASKYRPFCSERCKLIDLGAWAAEKYAIAKKPDEANDEGDDASSSFN